MSTATNSAGNTATDPYSDISDPSTGTSLNTASSPTGATSTTGSSSALSSINSDLSSFFSSPTGELAEFGTIAGLGEAQASSQAATNSQLAGTLGAAGAPYTQAGQEELGQITGGPAAPGALGASISQQTGAAAELGQTAEQYGTGQLTSAQQLQVQQQTAQQTAQLKTQLASSGNTDSSALDAGMQQIQNNAATLTQQLTQGNVTIATQALTAVQSTYSNILNQALSNASFGFGAQEADVQTQIQSNTQLSASLNSLFGALAQGFGTAMSGNKTTTNSTPSVPGTTGTTSGSGGVASTPAGGGTGTGDAGTGNANPGSTAPDITSTDFSTNQLFGGTNPGTDVSQQAGTAGLTPSFDTGFNSGSDPFLDDFDSITSDTGSTLVDDLASSPF